MPWLHVLSQRNEKHFRLTAAVRPDGVPEVDYPAEGRPGDHISRKPGHLVKFALLNAQLYFRAKSWQVHRQNSALNVRSQKLHKI